MADNMVKLSRGLSGSFTNLTKDTDTLYFLTDTKRIYLGGVEYTRPVDTELSETSENAISNKAVAAGLASYLQMGKDSAAGLYVPLAGDCTKTGTLKLNGQLTMLGNVIPSGTRSLGSNNYKWATAYITTTYGNLDGVAAKATILETARNFSINNAAGSGNAVSFNGSGNVALTVPNLMTGFESITSETFNVSGSVQMKYDDTNEYLYFSFS